MDEKGNLTNLKTMLAIGKDDTSQDEQLKQILSMESDRLKNKIHKKTSDEIPSELNYILIEVSIRRFNLLKNEGMDNYSQEGESIGYEDDEFDDFMDDINRYLIDNEAQSRGVARFI